METLFHDLRFGFRRLIKTPGFAVIAILSLALGIGANTAIFSLVSLILFRPLPVANPGEVVSVSPVGKDGASSPSPRSRSPTASGRSAISAGKSSM